MFGNFFIKRGANDHFSDTPVLVPMSVPCRSSAPPHGLTEEPSSPTLRTGFWGLKKWGKRREMGGNGGKWGNHEQINVENVGTTSIGRNLGGGGRGKIGEKRGRNGEKREKNGAVYPVFTVPFSLFPGAQRPSPQSSLLKINSPHSPTEKWEFLPLTDTHRHAWRRVRMVALGTRI